MFFSVTGGWRLSGLFETAISSLLPATANPELKPLMFTKYMSVFASSEMYGSILLYSFNRCHPLHFAVTLTA
jgi:hypothetical protein